MTEPTILPGCSVLRPLEPPRPRTTSTDSKTEKPKRSETTSNRFRELNAFVDATIRDLDGTTAKVWLILFRDTKPNGLTATSQTDLARRAGVSVRSIYKALRRLESDGLLTLIRKGRLGAGASVYRVRPLAKHKQ